jgi:hypothetical protein
MADSVTVANLPAGYAAYAGYVDGSFQTFPQLKIRFPTAHLLSIAVFTNSDADCLDIENGDATPAQAPAWARRQAARGEARPCLYANASTIPAVISALQGAGIARSQVRLWSAHYGLGPHICGPTSCKYPGVPQMDGTQYTDQGHGLHGSQIDVSALNDNFFGGTTAVSATGPEKWDNADWQAFRAHQLWNLTRALNGNTSGLAGADATAVENAHIALTTYADSIARAVSGAAPAGPGGSVSAEQIQQAVMAGLTAVLAKAVSGA